MDKTGSGWKMISHRHYRDLSHGPPFHVRDVRVQGYVVQGSVGETSLGGALRILQSSESGVKGWSGTTVKLQCPETNTSVILLNVDKGTREWY